MGADFPAVGSNFGPPSSGRIPLLLWQGVADMSRPTGFPPIVRSLVLDRSGGRCEKCGEFQSDAAMHHRRPRGAGSTRRPETNMASNALLLCGACHRHVESYRAQAFDNGWLVRQSHLPAEVPVLRRGQLVLLDDIGGFHLLEAA